MLSQSNIRKGFAAAVSCEYYIVILTAEAAAFVQHTNLHANLKEKNTCCDLLRRGSCDTAPSFAARGVAGIHSLLANAILVSRSKRSLVVKGVIYLKNVAWRKEFLIFTECNANP